MKNRREAFTLIEMLVVIAVIAILAGLAFKMMQIAKRNADRASTIAKIERLSHALNEYKAEYGTYPPVGPGTCQAREHQGFDCRMCYVFEDTNRQPAWLAQNFLVDNPNGATLFNMGLMAHLVKRDRDGIAHTDSPQWIPDSDRDEQAKERWAVFLEGVAGAPGPTTNSVEGTDYQNMVLTVNDSWGKPIRYRIDPPYMDYEMWSLGPDKQNGTADDIHKKTWDN